MNKPFYGVAVMPMSQRSQVINHTDVPGPGTYDFNKEQSHNQLPKWSFKKRFIHGSCFQNLSVAPGPGGYEADTAFKKLLQKKNATKGEKYKSYIQKNYGSSALNLPGSLNLKAGFSFGYREIISQQQKSPGPIYHLDKSVEQKRKEKMYQSSRGFGFGQKNAIYMVNSQTPGPGAFLIEQNSDCKSKTCEGWTFGTSLKSKDNSQLQLGPGQYDPHLAAVAVARTFKFQGKNEARIKIANNTGPGSYDISDTKVKMGTKFNISKKKHNMSQQSRSQEKLSPSTYGVKRYMDQPDDRVGYSLGKRLTEPVDRVRESPGPGAYQLTNEEILKKGGYMGKKIQKKTKQTLMDNFYKYNPNFNATSKDSFKFSFSQSKRYKQKENIDCQEYAKQLTPLTINQKVGYSYSIGTAKRFADLKKQSGPFKEMINDYSTIGNLPSYLKKSMKNK